MSKLSKSPKPFNLVALTGGMGSGKSTAGEIFRAHGVTVIDADQLARDAVAPDSTVISQIKSHFGGEFILPDGNLNRARMAELVFSDYSRKKELEAIIHPEVRRLLLQSLRAIITTPKRPGLVVYLIPLLFETRTPAEDFDAVISISCDTETALKRILKRDNISKELASKKIASQMAVTEKNKRADFVLDNSSTIEALHKQLDELLPKLKKLPNRSNIIKSLIAGLE